MNNFDFLTTEFCPTEVRNIEPGCVVVFAQDSEQGELIAQSLSHFNKSARRYTRFGFSFKTSVVVTDDSRLWNTIVAQRVNIGSIGKNNLIVCHVTNSYSIDDFFANYFDLNDTDDREIVVIENNLRFSTLPDVMTGSSHHFDEPVCCCIEAESSCDEFSFGNASEFEAPPIDPEENDINDLEAEKQLFCDKLSALIADFVSRHHQMPPMEQIQAILRGKILLGNDGLSELVVNKDLRIVLPAYNEIEIPLRPLAKALYFLFLRHPEGIRLVEIADYRGELEELYLLIMPNRDEELAATSISLLTDPLNSESLRQQISKIKRIVKAKILNEKTAEHYFISGKRGDKYSISLDRGMVRLPKAII